jgi:hypothetical protein
LPPYLSGRLSRTRTRSMVHTELRSRWIGPMMSCCATSKTLYSDISARVSGRVHSSARVSLKLWMSGATWHLGAVVWRCMQAGSLRILYPSCIRITDHPWRRIVCIIPDQRPLFLFLFRLPYHNMSFWMPSADSWNAVVLLQASRRMLARKYLDMRSATHEQLRNLAGPSCAQRVKL